MREVDEINTEDLQAAAEGYDALVAGTFYNRHEQAVKDLKSGSEWRKEEDEIAAWLEKRAAKNTAAAEVLETA